jgi:hypothetical protein
MSSTASYFTQSFPKRADITGSPVQAYNMMNKKYFEYILGGIVAGTIVALGTIAPGSMNFHYLFAPQIHHDLGGKPLEIVDNLSNKLGKFSCVYISLDSFKLFPFVEAAGSMNKLLAHTEVDPLESDLLVHTKDWKDMTDPVRGTLLPNFFVIYFGQVFPQGSILSDDKKTKMAM